MGRPRPLLVSIGLFAFLALPAGSTAEAQNIAGTMVVGDVDPRTMRAALEALPRRPERIEILDAKTLAASIPRQAHHLDGFVLTGSRTIYLIKRGGTLRAAEQAGGPYLLMLAVVIWHEMAHAEGLDERQARRREEDLWREFATSGMVESGVGLTYLAELRSRP